jgi:hypothetical protein
VFRAFWKALEADYALVKAEARRRKVHMPLTPEALDRIRRGVEYETAWEAQP